MNRLAKKFFAVPLFGLTLLAVGPCRAATALFNPAKGLNETPFPLALWQNPGGGLELPAVFPKKTTPFTRQLQEALATGGAGYSLTPVFRFPLSAPARLTPLQGGAATGLKKDAPLFLVGLSPGARDEGLAYPLFTRQIAADETGGGHPWLEVTLAPGVTLEPQSWYGLVLTRHLTGEDGAPLKPDLPFLSAFANTHRAGAVGFGFGLLQQAMTRKGRDLKDVVAATVFSTGDPMLPMWRLAEHQRTLKAPVFVAPAQTVTQNGACLVRGEVRLPLFQEPASGRILFKLTGAPAQFGSRALSLSVVLPARPVPGPGYPLVIAESDETLWGKTGPGPLVQALAAQGVAVMFLPPLKETKQDADAPSLFERRDRLRQRAADLAALALLARDVTLARGLCPQSAFKVRFAQRQMSVWGHGVGITPAAMALAAGRWFRAGVFSGPVPDWATHLSGEATPPKTLNTLRRWLGLSAYVNLPEHPWWPLLQETGAEVSWQAAAARLALSPFAGAPPRHVLVVGDDATHGAMALAAGLEAAGDFPRAQLTAPLKMAGLAQRPLPVWGNRRYGPFPLTGAWVAPQREVKGKNKGAWTSGQWRQAACFLTHAGASAAPEVIAPKGKLTDTCPAPREKHQ